MDKLADQPRPELVAVGRVKGMCSKCREWFYFAEGVA